MSRCTPPAPLRARPSTLPSWRPWPSSDIDISAERPRALTDAMARDADVVVTMGCGDSCPVYPGKRYIDWELPDPAGKPIEEVRPIRDDIAARVAALVDELKKA